MNAIVKPTMPAPTRAQVDELIAKVRENEPGSLERFKSLAQSHPAIVIEATHTDMQKSIFTNYAHTLSKRNGQTDWAKWEGVRAKFNLIVDQLAGKSRSPVRRLLAETVAFTWVEFWSLAMFPSLKNPCTQSPLQIKRQAAAQRRFLSALKTFAQVSALESKSPFDGNIFVNLFGDQPAAGEPPHLCIDATDET
jgi:hypothetical protein